MANFPCPYCGRDLDSGRDAEAQLERCPSCDGSLLIAYRHRLTASAGQVSGGVLYEAVDDGFGERVAVLFVETPDDPAAVERFIEGNRLFADLGGRGLVKIHDVGSDRRAYVVMDWLDGGTLDKVVEGRGALEQAELLAMIGDLLTAVGKAHRAMPAIVHGHIHPGKIGFRRQGQAVLFGFEWATKVNAQASRLADSYLDKNDSDQESRGPESDLRQLAAAFHYAATGEWSGDLDLDRQRERVRARVSGPLGQLFDRMLGAGDDGYKSAVEAAFDFEQLMRGVDSWQASSKQQQDRSAERMGTAWVDEASDEDDFEDDDVVELDDVEPMPAPVRTIPASRPSGPEVVIADWAALVAQRQAQAQAQARAAAAAKTPASNAARGMFLLVAIMMVLGTCVAVIIAESEDEPMPAHRSTATPPARIEPVLPPPPPIEISELPQSQPIEQPPRPELAGLFRYTGKVTGPAAFAGLRLGDRCEIWIEPNDSGHNCRWYIDCGMNKRRIYGGGSVGYSDCEVDDQGRPLRAEDEEDEAYDGAFLADLTAEPPMLIFEDRWIEPPVRVLITITEGGPHSGPVPDLRHAPRDTPEEIQRRIARGESPTIEAGVLAYW